MNRRENEPIQAIESLSPQRNLLAESRAISPQVRERAMARGRLLRSQALLRMLTMLARAVLNLAKRSYVTYRRWRQMRHAEQALRSLDAHLRRDIGIDGHQIPALARGLAKESMAASTGGARLHILPPRDSVWGDSGDSGDDGGDDCCVDRAA